MKITPISLIGGSVYIQPMDIYHVQELYEAGNSLDIWAYMPMKVQSIEDMKSVMNKALQAKGKGSNFLLLFSIRLQEKLWEVLDFLIYPYKIET